MYKSESARDYKELKQKITERARVLLNKSVSLQQISEREQVAPQDGLSQPELLVLANLAGETASPASAYSVWSLQKDCERAGLTAFGFGLGFRRLIKNQMVDIEKLHDRDGDLFDAAFLTDAGWEWVDSHEEFFLISHRKVQDEIKDDDLPF
jgi:hypothetical protein